MEDCIKELLKQLNLETTKEIEKIDSNQNFVYKITTKNNSYILKQYSKHAIKNKKELNLRKQQIKISEEFNKLGVKTIIPLKLKEGYYIYYKKNYFLIYNYYNYKNLNSTEINLKHIKIMAHTQAEIHKINLINNIECHYKKININLYKYLKKYKTNSDIYEFLNNNLDKLNLLIKDCNKHLKTIKNNLCISHNDYKLKNILWNKDDMYLIDFDACGLSNPTVSLIESAFSLSKNGNNINIEYYTEYLKEYIKTYGRIKDNYEDALAVAMNGKLQWLEYILSINKDIDEILNMLKELILFVNKKDEFLDIYLSL